MARNEAHREAQRLWYIKIVKIRRVLWFKENGPCAKCGCRTRLELDHIDPSKKISHNIWSWGERRRLEELKKCQVLCYRCHKKKSIEYCKIMDFNASLRKVDPEGKIWCSRCRDFLSSSAFTTNPSEPNGYDNYCRKCRSKRRSPHLWNGDKRIIPL